MGVYNWKMNIHILPFGLCALTVFLLIFIDFSCALFCVDVWELDVTHILLCILFGYYLGKYSFNSFLKSFSFEKFMNVYSEVRSQIFPISPQHILPAAGFGFLLIAHYVRLICLALSVFETVSTSLSLVWNAWAASAGSYKMFINLSLPDGAVKFSLQKQRN